MPGDQSMAVRAAQLKIVTEILSIRTTERLSLRAYMSPFDGKAWSLQIVNTSDIAPWSCARPVD